ncbi:hypothetical protein ARMSODRAFT_1018054 [Armillaria solidipes]|uniref:Uncharacterized protein n=1 Tax=Armillaria solidipes TaxID=1076256 RepID=A0A2H3C5E7_9AGAR|nr:hypothetical protein ARMSODRAFT_1018054 [Armillaria solidipes]
MSPITPLFNLVPIAPSSESSDSAIKTVQRAYQTVFGKDVPVLDQDDHLLLWTQICSSPGVPDSIVEESRRILPSLPDLTWKNVARVVGLDSSRGDYQLSGKPIQTLYLPEKLIEELLNSAYWRKHWNGKRQHVQLGSLVGAISLYHCLLLTSMMNAVKTILNKLGLCHDLFRSEPSFKFEMRIAHNAALLILESERSEPSDISEVCAQTIVEATCLAASNSRLGYSYPIHVVVTDLYETRFYTYDPSAKKLHIRGYFRVESFGSERDIGRNSTEVRESLLLRMLVVLTRDLFSLMMEAYHDYVQARISLFPDTETKAYERALELIEEGRTLLSNQQGTPEERKSGLKKLSTSALVLPWGKMRFTEEEMRVEDEEIDRMMRSDIFPFIGHPGSKIY